MGGKCITNMSPKNDCPRGIFHSVVEDGYPMATHGHGTLANLIKSRPTNEYRTKEGGRNREFVKDEENGGARFDYNWNESHHEYRSAEDRRLETILCSPQMRSQRLIGNSNSRYQWGET